MSKLGPLLFYGGLLLSAAGFLGDKADNLPPVLRLVAGSYVRASQGLDTLQSTGTLSPGQVGFSDLEQIFREMADKKNVRAQLTFQPVQKFERKTAMIAFGEARAGEVVPVDVVLSGGKVGWDMAGLREQADELRRSLLLRFSVAIFILGLVITIAGRVVERQPKRPNKAYLEPTAPTSSH